MNFFNRIRCPKCKSNNIKQLKDTMGEVFIYYRCKKCGHIWYQQRDWKEENKNPNGDNYPLLPDDSKLTRLANERKELMKELAKHGYKKITRNDILNMMIDLGLYNKRCKKRRRRKKKK